MRYNCRKGMLRAGAALSGALLLLAQPTVYAAGGMPLSNVLTTAIHASGPPPGGGAGGGGGGASQDGPPTEGSALPPGTESEPVFPGQTSVIRAERDGFTVEVHIPAGAVETEGTTTIRPLPEEEQPAAGAGLIRIGRQAYEIVVQDANGQPIRQFSQELTLTVAYDRSGLPDGVAEEDLQIFYWHEGLGRWILVPTELNPSDGTLTARVDHLTVFAVMAAPGLRPPADVRRHGSEGDVLMLLSLGAVSGYEDGTFRPGRTVTRAEFTKMLVELLDLERILPPRLPFRDVGSHWAAGWIAAAFQAGLAVGLSEDAFKPEAPITREQLAVMIARSLDGSAGRAGVGTATFLDMQNIAGWAREGVAAAAAAGIVRGYKDGSFRPQHAATRAEAAAMLARLVDVRLGAE